MTYKEYSRKIFFYLFIGIVLCIIMIIRFNRNFESFLPIALILAILLLTTLIINKLGKVSHKGIINSKFYNQLIECGFELEEKGEYNGLLGEYRNVTFRIYYDWNKLARSLFSFNDLVVLAYFQPLVKNFETGELAEEKIDILNQAYNPSFLKSDPIFSVFAPCFFVRHINYFPWLSAKDIISELDKIIKLLNDQNLSPISKNALTELQQKYPGYFAPTIETYPKEIY